MSRSHCHGNMCINDDSKSQRSIPMAEVHDYKSHTHTWWAECVWHLYDVITAILYLLQYVFVAANYSFISCWMGSLWNWIKERWWRSVTRSFTGVREFFCWLSHCYQLPMTQTLSRGDWGDNLIGLENSFGSILLKCCPIGVCVDINHSWSALGCFAPLSMCCKSFWHLLLGGIKLLPTHTLPTYPPHHMHTQLNIHTVYVRGAFLPLYTLRSMQLILCSLFVHYLCVYVCLCIYIPTGFLCNWFHVNNNLVLTSHNQSLQWICCRCCTQLCRTIWSPSGQGICSSLQKALLNWQITYVPELFTVNIEACLRYM